MSNLYDSTTEYRINSTAHKVKEAFNKAKTEARDECLWLSARCRELLADNKSLRTYVESLENKLKEEQSRGRS